MHDDRELQSLDDLMEKVGDEPMRKDLVYSLLIKAWDIGYCEGCDDVREGMREWAGDY